MSNDASDRRRGGPVELAHVEAGAGDPLVLIHGSFFDGTSAWRYQLDLLANDHRVIALDRRGHGRSPAPAVATSMADQAGDVVCLLDRLEIERATVIAWSYGGLIGLELGRRAPERLRALVLIEPPYTGESAGDPEVQAMIAATVPWVKRVADDPEAAVEALNANIDPAAGDPRSSRLWPDMVRWGARLQYEELYSEYRLPPEALAMWTVPTLMISGSASPPALRAMALDLSMALPGCEFQVIPGAGHGAQFVADTFNARLRGYLSKLPGR